MYNTNISYVTAFITNRSLQSICELRSLPDWQRGRGIYYTVNNTM